MDNPTDDRPLHEVQAYQVSNERHQWTFSAIVTVILIIGGSIVFLTAYNSQLKAPRVGIVFGLYASLLPMLLAFAYFLAFRFFDDLFYLFLSIGWLANALYLPFELLFDDKCVHGQAAVKDCFDFSLYIFSIAFASSISFYLSTLTKSRDTSSRSAGTLLSFWVVGIASLTGVSYLLINNLWPNSSYELRFAAYTVPGALFSAYGLLRVARHITGALKTPKGSSDRTLNVLSFTYYAP